MTLKSKVYSLKVLLQGTFFLYKASTWALGFGVWPPPLTDVQTQAAVAVHGLSPTSVLLVPFGAVFDAMGWKALQCQDFELFLTLPPTFFICCFSSTLSATLLDYTQQ